jgi:hypothetical protein
MEGTLPPPLSAKSPSQEDDDKESIKREAARAFFQIMEAMPVQEPPVTDWE